MTEKNFDLVTAIKRLQSRDIKWTEAFTILHDLGHTDLIEAEPVVAEFLGNEDPQLRLISLQTLCHFWKMRKYAEICESMLLTDPDDEVRSMACLCIGTLYWATFEKRIMALLRKILENESEDWAVRSNAYRSMFAVAGDFDRMVRVPRRLDYDKDVDWILVEQWQS